MNHLNINKTVLQKQGFIYPKSMLSDIQNRQKENKSQNPYEIWICSESD